MQFFTLFLVIFVSVVNAQIYLNQPTLAHPAVVENANWEQQHLPAELLKSNRFYDNPHTAAGLAKTSWFGDKEMPVFEREADKIERSQIAKIFHNAGLQKRR
ncbi:unnamed protein product [Diamesa serratosioi]